VAATGSGSSGSRDRVMSRGMQHRTRVLATQKLAKAYMLDEFAATFLMIHSATVLEGVTGLVLRHDESGRNVDAEYVHFFHEKIPTGKVLPRDTDLAPLDRLVDARPDEAALLRTRAVVKIFKEEPDLKGAEQDLAKALQLMEQQRHEITIPPTLQPGQKLKDDEMPSSLESQLRFLRGTTNFFRAVQAVKKKFSTPAGEDISEYRKAVRINAKHALNDFTRFVAGFDYAPNEGAEVVTLAQLLTTTAKTAEIGSDMTAGLTYHPFLMNALYSMLLCHLLLATPKKELQRYVSIVGHLDTIARVFPILDLAQSAAKGEWLLVVEKANLEFDVSKGGSDSFMANKELVDLIEFDVSKGGSDSFMTNMERADLIARWVNEGLGGAVARQKKRNKKKKEEEEVSVSAMQALTVG
jgi:hypothetical protein